jgi:hypothetical protein
MLNSETKAMNAVPMMEELSDEALRQMMGGVPCGAICSVTCDCGCWICTSWVYGCTRDVAILPQ